MTSNDAKRSDVNYAERSEANHQLPITNHQLPITAPPSNPSLLLRYALCAKLYALCAKLYALCAKHLTPLPLPPHPHPLSTPSNKI